eukprot:scaffold2735_cov61-Attheya_sp.AAC.8
MQRKDDITEHTTCMSLPLGSPPMGACPGWEAGCWDGRSWLLLITRNVVPASRRSQTEKNLARATGRPGSLAYVRGFCKTYRICVAFVLEIRFSNLRGRGYAKTDKSTGGLKIVSKNSR